MMNWMLRGCVRAAALVVMFTAVAVATSHAQTPEGTVITNTATVSWTDANGNAYAPVAGSVNVTVGFQAGIDVVAGGDVTPASPSSGNSISFTVNNIGNGDDNVTVDTTFTTAGVVTVTGWQLDGTPYGDLPALNAALAGATIAAGNNVLIEMVFDVNAGQGGQSVDYTLTATSVRTPATDDSDVVNIAPPAVYAASVTPDGSQNLLHLPTNGTNESFTFRVTNTGNITEDFDLTASNPGTAITVISVNGNPGTTDQINLAPAAFLDIVVEYQVGDVPVGTADTLVLAASPVSAPVNDDGFADMTVIRPVLTITKAAYRSDQSTVINPGDTVLPSETIWYLVTVTNNGTTDADVVHVDDLLPGEVTLQSTAANVGVWTITTAGNDVDADLTGTLAPTNSVSFWIEVQIN
jgi:uncharacterized repeat protein (TIGR01451 family)